jgi:DNA replication protein DnaC
MTNRQFDEVEQLAKLKRLNMRQCPTCKGSLVEVDPENPGVLGVPERRTYRYMGEDHECDCWHQDELRRHYLLAHIPMRYWRLGEQEYFGDPKAWDVAKDYLDHWESYRDQGLGLEFFSPKMGTGKTFLATYIARQLIQRGEPVFFTRFREIMGWYDRSHEERDEHEERLRHTPVLIFDEVVPPLSSAQGEYFGMEFEVLVRSRIDDDLVTLMTTNLRPTELEKHYPRTYSLLAAKQRRHEIKWEDVRRAGDVKLIDETIAHVGEVRPLC